MTETEMLGAAIKQYLLALRALPALTQADAISQAEEDAAGDAIIARMTTLSARLDTLIATGTGVTPIPDTGQVERLANAVTKLAAYNAAAGAWASILDTVLRAGDVIKAVAASGGKATKSAPLAGTAMPDRATLALALAGVAAAGAIFAIKRNAR